MACRGIVQFHIHFRPFELQAEGIRVIKFKSSRKDGLLSLYFPDLDILESIIFRGFRLAAAYGQEQTAEDSNIKTRGLTPGCHFRPSARCRVVYKATHIPARYKYSRTIGLRPVSIYEFPENNYLSKKNPILSSIAERVKQFNQDRLPAYTALKYQVMAENPFRFLRGTCHLFYEDLSRSDALPQYPLSWVCGDLHLENFGSYKGDNRLVYFDLNDYDEGALAPVTWELSRMVTSIFTGFDSVGVKHKEAVKMADLFLQSYSATLAKGRTRYLEPQTADGIVRLFLEKVADRKQKELIRQRTILHNEKLLLRIDRVRFFPIDKNLKKELSAHITQWIQHTPFLRKRYKVLDAAFRVAGTGSLGVKRYVFLLRNTKDPKKHLLIDMKQAPPSSLQPWLSTTQPSWPSEADRVVAIQERMQNVSPALLSTTFFQGDPYVLKEMQPTADKIDFLLIRDRYKDIECVIQDMAVLTASAQLRSAGRQGAALPDELIAFGKDHHWQQAMLDYSAEYAEQVKKDYQAYFKAYKSGYFVTHPETGDKKGPEHNQAGE